MCGLCGIVGPRTGEAAPVVDAMSAALAHRGPDGQGRYLAPSGACTLGHRRLAVIDLTAASSQPMLAEGGRSALAWNGELYNFRELRDELRRDGVEFRSNGDSEVVLRALLKWGEEALPRLNGMFALAYWDDENRALLLARDRFGQKPLYLARSGEHLLFASELRALLNSGRVERRLDEQGLLGYLCYGSVPGPGTLVRGVRHLEPGHVLRWSPGSEESVREFTPWPREKRPLEPMELREELRAAVRRHLVSDVPAGVFLSGGLDSASIAALAATSGSGRIATFTLAFRGESLEDESEDARDTATHLGTEHREVDITCDWVRQHLPDALKASDQPSGDGLNTWLVARAAREAGLTVALSGLGSDELFGGYRTFVDAPRMSLARRAAGPVSGLIGGAAALAGGSSPRRAGRIADLMSAPSGLLEAWLVRRRVLSGAQIRALMPGPDTQGWVSGLSGARAARLASAIDGLPPLDAVSRLELQVYMADTLLRDADAMGMAHALEIRMPFLDERFASAALALPASSRRLRTRPKATLYEAVRDLLPASLARRPKRGFTLPLSAWMRGSLATEVREGLEKLGDAGGPLSRDGILGLWKEFLRRPSDIGWFRPWMLFVLGTWLDRHEIRRS